VLCEVQRHPTKQRHYSSSSRYVSSDDDDYYSYSYYSKRQAWKGQLPTDLLPNILQYVNCRHRLSSCALVGRAWKAAAAAASKGIHITLPYDDATTHSLAQWLQQHGGGVVQSVAVKLSMATAPVAPKFACHFRS
jgi:hypothetical protein